MKNRVKSKNECPVCINTHVRSGFNDLATVHPHLAAELSEENKENADDTYSDSTQKALWECSNCDHVFRKSPAQRVKYPMCPKCSTGKSAPETEMRLFINSILPGVEVLYNTRDVIKGYELDVYVPSKGIAVEFNGIYWHSETVRPDRKYHYKKFLAAKEAGIQLIQIWEDEWKARKDTVKSALSHKLGVSESGRTFARKTKVVAVTYIQAKSFLDDNHIQGSATGTYYLGLEDDSSEMVAVMVLKGKSQLEIVRYATTKTVVGGFTKLMKYVENVYSPESFISFSDNCVSDGGLYYSNGFIWEWDVRPDYKYVVGSERKHKFGYRLKRFHDDPKLQYVEGLTEAELAALNKLHRIWDAGKIRWVKHLDKK